MERGISDGTDARTWAVCSPLEPGRGLRRPAFAHKYVRNEAAEVRVSSMTYMGVASMPEHTCESLSSACSSSGLQKAISKTGSAEKFSEVQDAYENFEN